MVEPKGVVFVVQGEELKATCNALSSLSTHTAWLKVTAATYTLKNTVQLCFINNKDVIFLLTPELQ